MADLFESNQPGNNIADLNRTAKHGSYAHFPGSGPPGKYCEFCSLYNAAENKKGWGWCIKFKQLMGHKGNQIRGNTSACKYFEQSGMNV